ncbi:helix-turn-helix domain-containing protein [Paenibacillus lautus]|uniref:helix-turn-helix domain-containing protein n=1 Tax=Paenibacillus lautus TaxID=1401 RepID=UPI001C7D7655|nr:helix-turn-helix domain-containing protein [Paenibacillus lautus]MBX4152304.1 helix-turn-helix domain-containing protein [Paenibacillus lautus]
MANNTSQERKEFLQDDGQLRVFIVPVDIMDVPDLTIYEQMTYIVLRSYVNPTDPTAFPSYPTIAKRGRMSRSSAIRAVEGLVQKGLITKEIRLDVSKNRKIKNTSNLYTLITPKNTESKQGSVSQTLGGGVSQTPGVVSDRNGGSVPQTPYHNHLKEPLLNMFDCMGTPKIENRSLNDLKSAAEEIAAASESVSNEIYETLQIEVPKYCFVQGVPLGTEYINEIYIMLLNQFPNQLSPEVISIACELYFDRACQFDITEGVVMTMDIQNPTGFFQHCYKDAIKQYKASHKRKKKDL